MSKPRDSQRQKVYDSETAAKKDMEDGGFFISTDECREYILSVMNTKWFRDQWPHKVNAEVSDGRSRRSACGWPTEFGVGMSLPRRTRKKWIILHEMAHGLQPKGTAGHGPEFCRIYLLLVNEFLGDKAYKSLREQMHHRRVKIEHRMKPYAPVTSEVSAVV